MKTILFLYHLFFICSIAMSSKLRTAKLRDAPVVADDVPTCEQKESLKRIFNRLNYEDYTKVLDVLADDEASFQEIQEILREEAKNVSIKKKAFRVDSLFPTQNEIGLPDSLGYPFEHPPEDYPLEEDVYIHYATDDEFIEEKKGNYFVKGKPAMVPGKPIVTFNGKYIIDGHHRWSQIFMINPEARIVAYDLEIPTDTEEPINALKMVQRYLAQKGTPLAGIEANTLNVFKVNEFNVTNYIRDNMQQGFVSFMYQKGHFHSFESIVSYLVHNIQKLQDTKKPIPGAPLRIFMPQTDAKIKIFKKLTSKDDSHLDEGITEPEPKLVSQKNFAPVTQQPKAQVVA